MKKHLDYFARCAGFVAMGLEWFALIFFILREPYYFSGRYPISYFAALPTTQWVFSLCYFGAAICFWLFSTYHLKKHFVTPIKTFSVSMLLFSGLALYPYNPSNPISSTVHNWLAILSLGLFYLGMLFLAKYSSDQKFRLITSFSVVISMGLMIGFATIPRDSALILPFETSAWFVCQLWIVWISYLAYKRSLV